MQAHEESYSSDSGIQVFRRHYRPVGGEDAIRGAAVFVHGLGDHGGRHTHVLKEFVARGIYCVAADLPGHGNTAGTRGFIPSLETVHAIVSENLRHAQTIGGTDAPLGLLGHSMGGFLALDYLSRHPHRCSFSWISSPLIDARWNKSIWLQRSVVVLGSAAPRLPIPSGLRTGVSTRDPERILARQKDPLMHRRLTMRLGKLLLDATEQLPDVASGLDPDLRLLITHGSSDTICPSDLSLEFFNTLPLKEKHFALLDGLLHEPFNDIGREAFFETLNSWLNNLTDDWNAAKADSTGLSKR